MWQMVGLFYAACKISHKILEKGHINLCQGGQGNSWGTFSDIWFVTLTMTEVVFSRKGKWNSVNLSNERNIMNEEREKLLLLSLSAFCGTWNVENPLRRNHFTSILWHYIEDRHSDWILILSGFYMNLFSYLVNWWLWVFVNLFHNITWFIDNSQLLTDLLLSFCIIRHF